MNLDISLELPSIKRKKEAIEFIKEFRDYNSAIHGSGGLSSYDDYDEWLLHTLKSHNSTDNPLKVPTSTYFAIDELNNIVGIVNIRHYLNEQLERTGSGHVGYGVRPTQRRKGYGTKILSLALEICKGLNIEEALLGCYKDNIGSNKVVLNNGGILLKEINEEDGKVTLAYTIKL